ncbi:uncharacterized protein LOC117322410 [Pecten maximus]|uniref:uncharacterized protein LOC117322410 n=1 Tax=Pecten maximus TaxID=6579 RepID=UPI0014586EA6|nr:uncharacterized protein LOC117322410 [Pecten maximus]
MSGSMRVGVGKMTRSPIYRSYSYLKRLYCEKLQSANQRKFCDDKQTAHTFPRDQTLPMLNENHRSNILSIINDLPEKQFRSLKEMQTKQSLAENILKFRFKNGKISDVNELIKNNVASFECLQNVCTELQSLELLHQDFCYPGLLRRQIENLQSIVVIDIETLRSVSWIKVNRQLEVEDWSHAMLIENPNIKISDHVFHHNVAKAAVSRIPKGCIYIVRDTSLQFRNDKLVKAKDELHYRVMHSVFMTVLKSSLEEKDSDVYVVDMKKIPDIYDTLVVKYFDITHVNNYKLLKDVRKNPDLFRIQMTSFPNIHHLLHDQYACVALLANSFCKLVLCNW